MENIPASGLSEKELLEFLHEIECLDEGLQEAEDKADQAEYEEQSWLESIKEQDIKERGEFIVNGTSEEKAERARRIHRERALLKTRIQRSAFDQSEIPLTQELTTEDIKMLIEAVTEEQAGLVEYYSVYITKRIKALLTPLIPSILRAALKSFPNSVKECPGFLYRVCDEEGKEKVFFVKPPIPYFIEQGTEMQVIKSCDPAHVQSINKAVLRYHNHREKLFAKETAIASAVSRFGIRSYFNLLNHNVIWFSRLYLKKTGKPLKLVD